MTLTPDGRLLDNDRKPVNEKGYLVDPKGNIIDHKHDILFPKSCLLSGEFPKIFPFTKFNPNKVMGDFDRDIGT